MDDDEGSRCSVLSLSLTVSQPVAIGVRSFGVRSFGVCSLFVCSLLVCCCWFVGFVGTTRSRTPSVFCRCGCLL